MQGAWSRQRKTAVDRKTQDHLLSACCAEAPNVWPRRLAGNHLRTLRPSAVKGAYVRKVSVSATMSPGITLDVS